MSVVAVRDCPGPDLPEEAWLACLVALPGAGPARLRALLGRWPPAEAWAAVTARRPAVGELVGSGTIADEWCAAARSVDVGQAWQDLRGAGIGVLGESGAGYPDKLRDDPDPPVVLFTAGEPTLCSGRTVAIVGTRQCTRYGVELAFELGRLLAEAGVSVVSGLAAGIDAAAHSGALDAASTPPIAVVGSGVDRPYPARNRPLWRRVAAEGLVCSEAPMGSEPRRWRFPARNRIIAGLSEVVVVVESHERGGSLSTAAEAMARDRPVFAVPGPIRSPASVGTNRLIADGCTPLCALDDVLVALDLVAPTVSPWSASIVEVADARLLELVGWQPVTFDELVSAVEGERDIDEVALQVERLVVAGALCRRGVHLERSGRPVRSRGDAT